MFTRILVPLDGSARAEHAIPIAARLARSADGTVMLLAVEAFPVEFHPGDKRRAEIESPATIDADLNQAHRYLDSVATMPELVGVKTQTKVLVGSPAPSILNAIELLKADLVVMCSHGSSGLKRWALGSVAHKIVPYSPVPVLLLPEGSHLAADQSICSLVPLDGSPLAETALAPAVELVAALSPDGQRSLHVIRVVDVPVASGIFRPNAHVDQEFSRAEARREAHKYLAGIAAQLTEGDYAQYDLTVTTSVSVNTDVAEALVEKAGREVEGFDLIAMATHGRSGLQRWVMGSVTDRVINHTKMPVLVVHPAHSS